MKKIINLTLVMSTLTLTCPTFAIKAKSSVINLDKDCQTCGISMHFVLNRLKKELNEGAEMIQNIKYNANDGTITVSYSTQVTPEQKKSMDSIILTEIQKINPNSTAA